jgi:isoleucyl-tRNA synthetase
MYEIVEQPRTGWSVVSDGTHAVALDTTLTPELELEGAARELVRAINEQRKAVGLDLSDRIHLQLAIEPITLDAALAEGGHLELVAHEVLAESVSRTEVFSSDAAADGTMQVEVAEVTLGELGSARIRVTRT